MKILANVEMISMTTIIDDGFGVGINNYDQHFCSSSAATAMECTSRVNIIRGLEEDLGILEEKQLDHEERCRLRGFEVEEKKCHLKEWTLLGKKS